MARTNVSATCITPAPWRRSRTRNSGLTSSNVSPESQIIASYSLVKQSSKRNNKSFQYRILSLLTGMINDNFQPEESARKCANKLGWDHVRTLSASQCSIFRVDFESLHRCAIGREGEELHYKAGVKTESLSPSVSFIPTIGLTDPSYAADFIYSLAEIEGSQHSQKAILKDFKKEVCRIYTEKYLRPGQKMANCS